MNRSSIRIAVRKVAARIHRITPRSLTLRYTLALVAIAVLVVLEQLFVQSVLNSQINIQKLARTVEIQQFEIQRFSKQALVAQLSSTDPSSAIVQLRALNEIGDQVRARHGEIGQILAQENHRFEEKIKPLIQQTRADYLQLGLEDGKRWRNPARHARASELYGLRHEFQNVQIDARVYRDDLHALLSTLDDLASSTVRFTTKIDLLFAMLILFVLFLEGRYIFRPSIRGLESALRTRSDFMSRMSHEIRNPINSIMGMTEALKETPLHETQSRYLDLLSNSSQTLLDLLNHLLDFSALESGKTRIERIEFDLYSCLEKVIDVCAVRAHGKNLDIILDMAPNTPMFIYGDPVRLQQVLVNLLTNAIKFTSAGEVRLSVRPELSDGKNHYLTFKVIDTGIGIKNDSLGKIFDSFVQADNSTLRKYGGSGLGLTISRDLVHLMGGQISVKSEVGRGSVFKFVIPCSGPNELSETLLDRMKQTDLTRLHIYAFGPMNGLLAQAADLIQSSGGRIETRFDMADLQAPNSVVLTSAQEGDSIMHFFPENLPRKARVVCIISTRVSAQQMRVWMNFGITDFIMAPLKPLSFIQHLQKTIQKEPSNEPVIHSHFEAGLHDDSQLSPTIPIRKRILVVDDAPENRELIELYLKRSAIGFSFAANGAEAVQRFQSEKCDLVLMDLQMPVMGGREAAILMRDWERSQSLPQTPIIAITGDTGPEIRKLMRESGFNACVEKPLKKSEIVSIVTRFLQSPTVPPQATTQNAQGGRDADL